MNCFCIFNDNLRKFLLAEAGSVNICHLLCVVMSPSDHTLFPVSFLFSSLSFLVSPFFSSFLLPSSKLPPFLICMCYCKSPIQMEVYMPLANFKPGFKNGRQAAEYVLCLQCHTLIPSSLFTDINANWENN